MDSSQDSSQDDPLIVAEARAKLRRYPVLTEPYSKFYAYHGLFVDPKRLLEAALNYAPTAKGKVYIADMILETVNKKTDIISNFGVEKLARQLFTNLLVPRLFLHLRS